MGLPSRRRGLMASDVERLPRYAQRHALRMLSEIEPQNCTKLDAKSVELTTSTFWSSTVTRRIESYNASRCHPPHKRGCGPPDLVGPGGPASVGGLPRRRMAMDTKRQAQQPRTGRKDSDTAVSWERGAIPTGWVEHLATPIVYCAA